MKKKIFFRLKTCIFRNYKTLRCMFYNKIKLNQKKEPILHIYFMAGIENRKLIN